MAWLKSSKGNGEIQAETKLCVDLRRLERWDHIVGYWISQLKKSESVFTQGGNIRFNYVVY